MRRFDNPRFSPDHSTLAKLAAAEAAWLRGACGTGPPAIHPKPREERIRELAYLRAERRGFTPGFDLEDWLSAERELTAARPDLNH